MLLNFRIKDWYVVAVWDKALPLIGDVAGSNLAMSFLVVVKEGW